MPNDFDTSQFPLGSPHPYVLYNNAGNEDLAVNDVQNEFWTDRPPFNRRRKTLYGIEQDFNRAIAKIGYESVHLTYTPGQPLTINRATQLIDYNGSVYRVKMPAMFPVVLTGVWATDASKLVDIGDVSLRQALAAPSGGQLVGDPSYGSVAAGIADLRSKAVFSSERFVAYNGGQLNSLFAAMCDLTTQFVGITLHSDSTGWGLTTAGMGAIEPRTGSLTDARNNGSAPSWANLFHKFLGREFYAQEQAVEGIWPGTPSGVAQFTYTKPLDLFPSKPPFTNVGAFSELAQSGTVLGSIWFVNTNVSGSGPHSVSWQMSGKEFDLIYAQTPEGAGYRVYVDEVLQGSYTTNGTAAYGQKRTHSFPFNRTAKIRIEVIGGVSAFTTLRIESIRINKTLRFTNQSIIGVDSFRYATVIINDAFRSDDSYAIVALGINDSALPAQIGNPTSPGCLSRNLGVILDRIESLGGKPILMCENQVLDNNSRYYSMRTVRNVIAGLAKTRKFDFIDNFALIDTLIKTGQNVLADLLHPNDAGHAWVAGHAQNAIQLTPDVPVQLLTTVEVINGYTVTKSPDGTVLIQGAAPATTSVGANASFNGSITLPIALVSAPSNSDAKVTAIPTASFDTYGAVSAYVESASVVQYIIRNGVTPQTFNLRLKVVGRWK